MFLKLDLRRDGSSGIRFAPKPRWSDLHSLEELSPVEAQQRLHGKRVCLLIPGYHAPDLEESTSELALRISDWYDAVILAGWPNSHFTAAFIEPEWLPYSVFRRADEAGQRIAAIMRSLPAASIDVEAHSLGNRVMFEALVAGMPCRNWVSCGAAVPHDALQSGQRYAEAAARPSAGIIAYSANDQVLRHGYTLSRWDTALGLTGPTNWTGLPLRIFGVDLSAQVHRHSDYKRSPLLIRVWEEMAVCAKA